MIPHVINASARKHYKRDRLSDADILAAADCVTLNWPLDEDNPSRWFLLGFDEKFRLLELIVLRWDDGVDEIIHAMKARSEYHRLVYGP